MSCLCRFYHFGARAWQHSKFVDCYAWYQQVIFLYIIFSFISSLFLFSNYIIMNLINSTFSFRSTENSPDPPIWCILYIGCKILAPCLWLPSESNWIPKVINDVRRTPSKLGILWHNHFFLDYMYIVSSSTIATMCFMFIHLRYTLRLYVLINTEVCLTFQQELNEASDIALN